ncbi:hypothetical protein CTI12_AA456950 [Artemisia annua]|uniref:Uncharacterized protein n=1 Tax=Artemisia annua TaxID=35608 RepID=A0A2U1LT68_ARTAN|nr:hypothetical protein CTI12_AA456950 [Artemisia annua]
MAAGFSALAPTLGTITPVIGAGGFATVPTAAGSVAGYVVVAALFSRNWMTRELEKKETEKASTIDKSSVKSATKKPKVAVALVSIMIAMKSSL